MTYYSALHYAAKAEKSASEAALHNLKNKITNCITEIPQDIKLELNDGVLTLKAGSKVYVPNGKNADGSLKFDEVVIAFDLSTAFDNNNQKMVFVNPARNGINHCNVVNQQSSGETSTSTSSYNFWYDTTSNNVKFTNNSGSTWTSGYSLPICLVTKDSGIDQVFNGFGYIGSTVFALPGVKGLIPNGRNEDGSLRNTEFTVNKVVTKTQSTTSYNGYLTLNSVAINTPPLTTYEYDELNNITKYNGAKTSDAIVGQVTCLSGVITSFTPKLPFRAADDQEVVKLDGDNVFSGNNSFVRPNGSFIELKNTTVSLSDTTKTGTSEIWFRDKNDIIQGIVEHQNRGNSVATLIAARNMENTAWVSLEVGYDANGNAFSAAPIPPTTSNSQAIATTAWVRNQAVGFPNYSAAVSIADSTTSYTPPSNGIIQMGYLSAGDNSYSGGVTHPSGLDIVSNYSAYKYSNGGTFWCIVEKGVTYSLTTSQPNKKFIPFK